MSVLDAGYVVLLQQRAQIVMFEMSILRVGMIESSGVPG